MFNHYPSGNERAGAGVILWWPLAELKQHFQGQPFSGRLQKIIPKNFLFCY